MRLAALAIGFICCSSLLLQLLDAGHQPLDVGPVFHHLLKLAVVGDVENALYNRLKYYQRLARHKAQRECSLENEDGGHSQTQLNEPLRNPLNQLLVPLACRLSISLGRPIPPRCQETQRQPSDCPQCAGICPGSCPDVTA